METLDKYPEIAKLLEDLCSTRRDEIIAQMIETDSVYKKLCRERAEASSALKNALDVDEDELFEKYSDTIYAQEIYEIDAIYRQAFCDAVNILKLKELL